MLLHQLCIAVPGHGRHLAPLNCLASITVPPYLLTGEEAIFRTLLLEDRCPDISNEIKTSDTIIIMPLDIYYQTLVFMWEVGEGGCCLRCCFSSLESDMLDRGCPCKTADQTFTGKSRHGSNRGCSARYFRSLSNKYCKYRPPQLCFQ